MRYGWYCIVSTPSGDVAQARHTGYDKPALPIGFEPWAQIVGQLTWGCSPSGREAPRWPSIRPCAQTPFMDRARLRAMDAQAMDVQVLRNCWRNRCGSSEK